MKKEKHLNLVLMIVIIIILILLIINNSTNNKSNKSKQIQLVEGFTEPKQYHKPIDFQLYQIDNDNNLMSFIFKPPTPLIVANQVDEYILVVVSYINVDSEGELKHLETITYRKSPDTLTEGNEKLLKNGQLMFTINKPQDIYKNSLNDKDIDILYKFGLMIKYPNTYSTIANVNNLSGPYFNLKDNSNNFNYSEQALISSCPSSSSQVSLTSDITEFDKNQDPTINQLKDMLGGFPDSLNIQDLDHTELSDIMSKKNQNINLYIDYDKNLDNN